MSFQLEQSSVIKTAPPGARSLETFPKQEPLELAPLTQVQDLSKVQVDYYQTYPRSLYQEYNIINPTQSALIANPTSQLFYQQQVEVRTEILYSKRDLFNGNVETSV